MKVENEREKESDGVDRGVRHREKERRGKRGVVMERNKRKTN